MHPPVNNNLLQQRPVIVESNEVDAADVALVRGELVWAALVVIGGPPAKKPQPPLQHMCQFADDSTHGAD